MAAPASRAFANCASSMSRHGPKETLVADLSGGVSFFWADLAKVDFVLTWRSKEFVGQPEPDRYGGVNISVKLP